MQPTKEYFQNIASLSGWDVAKELGCRYFGDANPIEHGGFFYEISNWKTSGYARCVEFWWDCDRNQLVVQQGTIHRPNEKTLEFMLKTSGVIRNIWRESEAQITTVYLMNGVESDGEFPGSMRYKLSEWAEWRIWRSCHRWLTSLAS